MDRFTQIMTGYNKMLGRADEAFKRGDYRGCERKTLAAARILQMLLREAQREAAVALGRRVA